jgi:hypothetical protein
LPNFTTITRRKNAHAHMTTRRARVDDAHHDEDFISDRDAVMLIATGGNALCAGCADNVHLNAQRVMAMVILAMATPVSITRWHHLRGRAEHRITAHDEGLAH